MRRLSCALTNDEGPIAYDNLYDGGYVYMEFMYDKYIKRYFVKDLTFFRYTGIRNNDLYTYWWSDYANPIGY